jgi:hypothetical protein
MSRFQRRRYLHEPDYSRPPLEVSTSQRERIIDKLTVL